MAIIKARRKRTAPIPVLTPFLNLVSTRVSTFMFGGTFAACGVYAQDYSMLVGSAPILMAALLWKDTKRFLKVFDRFAVPTQVLVSGLIVLSGIFLLFVLPADAVFLDGACNLLESVFQQGGTTSGAAGDPIKITIDIIRAMFIIYLAISLIHVFNLMRQDEDWQMAVRAPVLAVLIIVIVEAITAMVTTNTGTCG